MAVRGFAKGRDRCESRSPDLTVWSKVPVEKPVDPRLLNKFSACLESKVITMLTRARNYTRPDPHQSISRPSTLFCEYPL